MPNDKLRREKEALRQDLLAESYERSRNPKQPTPTDWFSLQELANWMPQSKKEPKCKQSN